MTASWKLSARAAAWSCTRAGEALNRAEECCTKPASRRRPSCLRMLDGDARSSLPIWPQVEGPFLSRKRMIRLRVRFIKMLDMETTT